MKKSITRVPLVQTPNVWLGDEKTGVWEYGDYKYCYLTVLRVTTGKYVPFVNGVGSLEYPDAPLPECRSYSYETLEEAKQHCFDYVDWVRNVRDQEAREILQKYLENNRPETYKFVKKSS